MSEQTTKENNHKKRTRFSMPDSYIILFIMLIIAAVATYIIPAGSFDREEGGLVPTVIPDSFTNVEGDPVGIMDFFVSIQGGMMEAPNIIFLVVIICGD